MSERRRRTHRVQVRLNDDEYEYFRYNLSRTGLTAESYLRKIIADKIPKTREARQLDRDILSQLYAIGNNLNQIARRANDVNIISVDKFNAAVEDFKKIMNEFLERD